MSTETGRQEARLKGLSESSLASILEKGLLPLQASRGAAYGRLNEALRASMSGGGDNYALVCANCTEDLKLASEGVISLRLICSRRAAGGDASFKAAVSLLDRLQTLEEQKMVAIVSVHAIKRSRKSGGDETMLFAIENADNQESVQRDGGRESADQKIVRFSKRLMNLDESINELMDETREIIVDADEDAETG